MRCQRSLFHRLITSTLAKEKRCAHFHTVTLLQNRHKENYGEDNDEKRVQTELATGYGLKLHQAKNPLLPASRAEDEEQDTSKKDPVWHNFNISQLKTSSSYDEPGFRTFSTDDSNQDATIEKKRSEDSTGKAVHHDRNFTQPEITSWAADISNDSELDLNSFVSNKPNSPSPESIDETETSYTEQGDIEYEHPQYKKVLDKYRSMFPNHDPTTEVYPYTLSYATSIHMVHTLRKLRELGLPDHFTPMDDTSTPDDLLRYDIRRIHTSCSPSQYLQKRMQKRARDTTYQRLFSERKKLPIQRRETVDELIQLIRSNDVVVLVSQTGSGKTTQLPQIILDWRTAMGKGESCNIICTQPRRLAAMSIARRVAVEQRTRVGAHVGYSVRFDRQSPQQAGSISYWTAGILLKSLYEDPQKIIDSYAYLVIDEVHERDLTTDLVLTALRDLMHTRRQSAQPFPKVILMSATIDALDFQRYFEEPLLGVSISVGTLEVPGRNYGVEVHTLDKFLPDFAQYALDNRFMSLFQNGKGYLMNEDKFAYSSKTPIYPDRADASEPSPQQGIQARPPLTLSEADEVPIGLIAATVAHAIITSDEGDVLVFLPGIAEIDRVSQNLQAGPLLDLDFTNESKIRIYKLHGSLYETNERVFESVPDGCRRVVLATNIAQTSITLPDVVHVVDAGQQRRVTYNPISHVNDFKCYWIDKSASTQRRGRAGRTRPGHYWTLFTRARFESFLDKPLPEIKTTNLTSACLAIKAQVGSQGPLKNTLSRAMDPPDPVMIDPAVEELKRLRMLTEDEEVTPLGRFAAWFPVQPATARALLYGVLFRCLEPMLILAAHNNDKPLIHNPKSLKSQVQSNLSFAEGVEDDRAAFIAAFRSYDTAIRNNLTEEIAELAHQNVRENAYREMVNVAQQLCGMMSVYEILKLDKNAGGSVFEQLPPYLSEYASSDAFVKSMALSVQHSNLGVYNAKGRSYYVGTTPVLMKPFSVNSQGSMKMADHPDIRCNGQVMSYSRLMQLPGTTLPLMTETSNISPLMAMLFGGPIEIINKNTVQVNGWLKYQISVQDEAGNQGVDNGSAVGLILEFRRTLDRFVQLTCAGLKKRRDLGPFQPPEAKDAVDSFISPGNPLTEAFTQGLKAAMDSDAASWDEYLLRNSASEETDDKARR